MEVYLSRLILNARSREVRRDIGNKREVHRTICKAFPKIEASKSLQKRRKISFRKEYNILFRLDIDERRGTICLLVQSTARPDWSFLPEDYLCNDTEEPLACKTVQDSFENIKDGTKLIFRLQANPTKRIGKSDPYASDKFKPSANCKPRRRVELRSDEERINWLRRKGSLAGFDLEDVKIKPNIKNVASVRQEKTKVRKRESVATFGLVVFEGVLTVTDANAFQDVLIKGIGQGKAYGFGLLSVASVRYGDKIQ